MFKWFTGFVTGACLSAALVSSFILYAMFGMYRELKKDDKPRRYGDYYKERRNHV